VKISEGTKWKGEEAKEEELCPEVRAEGESKGSCVPSARGGFYTNAQVLPYLVLSVGAAVRLFAGMLIAFALPLPSIRMGEQILNPDRADLIFCFSKGKIG